MQRKLVKVAQAAVAGEGELLVTLGLGSCVAILLHDPVGMVAGLAHVLLPEPRNGTPGPVNEAKFATTAVPHLVALMEEAGARRARLQARLVGGASMFGALLAAGAVHVGERNLQAARRALQCAGIPILAEEVGREHGRSVYFDPGNGRTRVVSLVHGEVVI